MFHSRVLSPNFPTFVSLQDRGLVCGWFRGLLVRDRHLWCALPVYSCQLYLEQESTGPLYQLCEVHPQHRHNQHYHRFYHRGHAYADSMEPPATNH